MKKTLVVCLLIIGFISCSEKEVEITNLVDRNGVMYEVNSDKPFTGRILSKYKNQQFKTVGFYKKGLKNKMWEHFKENGQVTHRIQYKKGKQNGLFEEFNDGNIKIISKQYRLDSLDGDYKTYDEKGKLSREGIYNNNKKTGEWKSYRRGYLDYTSHYKNDLLDGEFTRYDNKGVATSIGIYKQGKKEGVFFDYYTKNLKKSKSNYKNDKLLSIKKWNKKQNVIFDGTYPGICTWYDDNGSKKVEGFFKNTYRLKESSLKVWFRGKETKPNSIFTNSLWKGENFHTGKKRFNEYFTLRFGTKSFSKSYLFSEKTLYAHSGVSKSIQNQNSGSWKINTNVLPSLSLVIDGRSYENLDIYNLSNNQFTANGKTYTRISQ